MRVGLAAMSVTLTVIVSVLLFARYRRIKEACGLLTVIAVYFCVDSYMRTRSDDSVPSPAVVEPATTWLLALIVIVSIVAGVLAAKRYGIVVILRSVLPALMVSACTMSYKWMSSDDPVSRVLGFGVLAAAIVDFLLVLVLRRGGTVEKPQ